MIRPNAGTQFNAIQADWCPELFFGGARGGGKSFYLLLDFLQDVPKYGKAWQGIVFRRSYPELQDLIKKAKEIFFESKATWYEQAKEFRWANGAVLKFRYIEKARDADMYQGHEYTWIGWDELQQWENDEAYFKLLACLRSSSPVPTKRIRAGGNPGGIGHSWIKKYFIDPFPKGNQLIIERDSSRMYIPSRVSDNPELLKNDPEYISRLKRVGNEQLVKAWLEGDWSIIAGAYYPEFNLDLHVVKPVTLPSYWFKYRSFDWGSAEPFFVHWIAVSDGQEFVAGNNRYWFPKGALIFYREWNGCNLDKPSEGLRLRNEEIANGIKLRTHENNVDTTLTDSLPFQSRGGPTIASVFYDNGVPLTKADTERITGWTHVRDRLIGVDDMPLIYIFESNKYTIQYFPALQIDDRNPEDAVQSGEPTHCLDGVRYASAAFPIIKEQEPEDKPIVIEQPTFDEVMKYVKRKNNGGKKY
jgi:hypothetical protein